MLTRTWTSRAARAGLACLAAAAAVALAGSRGASASAVPGLTVPPGFEVELVAGPPLVNRPIVADFDEQGRLYVADSSGSNDKVDKQLTDKPHRIVRLEDTDGDGRFDKSVVFADRMMFPEGTMWFDGSLYVAAPPSIWKLTDTDGDGVADRREEWFEGKTLTNCANDLHGPYLGPDGWIYWTKGAFAQQTYQRPGKPPLVTRAAHIFRRHPSRTEIEPVMTGGMDNPVDVAFTPAGERLFTATFLEHPQLGRRDALVHAIYGGVYGKPHAVIDGHTRTGDLMPVLAELGPAVPAGLTRYASRAFGDAYRDNFFATLFNLRKVVRFVLEPNGATFKTQAIDFLASDNRDFHPTDVLADADGSLLVVDTGPWYKLCCPTSQLAKPEILGAIYRVRRQGAAAPADPRGRKIDWSTLAPSNAAALLDDGRPAVRERAIDRYRTIGASGVPALETVLRTSSSAEARRNAVWALTRIDAPAARAAVRRAVKDRDASVSQTAMHSAAVWRDAGAAPALVEALGSAQPALRRAAAEALGRVGDGTVVPALIGASAAESDRVLEHSITYALIEIGNPAATVAAGLQAAPPRARRAALIALDQMEGGGLRPDGVLGLLDSRDPLLKETAWWIAGRHADWGPAMAGYFAKRLSAPGAGAEEQRDLQRRIVQFGDSPAIQELLAATLASGTSREATLGALEAMSGSMSRVKQIPAVWIPALVRALDGQGGMAREAVAVVRAAPSAKQTAPELRTALLRVARDGAQPDDIRLDALAGIQEGLTEVDAPLFDLLIASVDPGRPVSARGTAAAVIEKASLDREQLLGLARALSRAGPLETPRLLRPFDHSTDETVGLAMVAALEQSKGRSTVRADTFKPRLAKYPASVQAAGERLLQGLSAQSARQVQRLEELLTAVAGGDVGRGQAVFNSAKAGCFSCHAIGYLGGRIGPDLTRIGQVRTDRDLLEAIVFPNASFARGYETVVITTAAGDTHAGMVRSEGRDELVIATGEQQETRVPRNRIADMQPGVVSLMPAGFDEQLSRQELADLVAFLRASR